LAFLTLIPCLLSRPALLKTMFALPKHNFPIEAWAEMALGYKSPDSRIAVNRVAELPPQCSLWFGYESKEMPEHIQEHGDRLDSSGDFYAGVEPLFRRLTIIGTENGTTKYAVEWRVEYRSVIYRAKSKVLYVCAPISSPRPIPK
jgi:hypothetical protein